jgi:hypothetical protein
MFCVAHGGGKRCQYPEGCDKGAEGRIGAYQLEAFGCLVNTPASATEYARSFNPVRTNMHTRQ